MKGFCWLSAELDSCQTAGAKDQPLSRALPCTNLLHFHAEIQVRVSAVLGSLNFGWVCSLAAQLWAALAPAMKATGGAVLAGASAERGRSGSWWRLQRCWPLRPMLCLRLLWLVSVPGAPRKRMEILYPGAGACRVSWLL